MNKEEQIKRNIERLNSEKHDVEFEITQILSYFLGLIILIATMGVTVGLNINSIEDKIIIGLYFIALIIFLGIIFNIILGNKGKIRIDLIDQIKNEYSKFILNY